MISSLHNTIHPSDTKENKSSEGSVYVAAHMAGQ